tara:strand:- start:292 stop:567 length:276 start_codon:yes stop_codon:yes gene_type:complete
MSEIKKLAGEKHGPFVRRRETMKNLKMTTVLEYLQYLQNKHEDEEAVKHLNLGGGGYKRAMKKKRKSRKSKRRRKKKKKTRKKRKSRKRRR